MEPCLEDLRAVLARTAPDELAETIVNAPYTHRVAMVTMGIGIIVLLIQGNDDGLIHRVALSKTDMAEGTLKITSKKFEDIKVPSDDKDNIIAAAIRTGKPQMTDDWRYLFTPALSPEQARLNQAGGSIACSHVYPLKWDTHKGALIFSYFKEPSQIGKEERDFMDRYSKLASEAFAKANSKPANLINA